jgi:hypothetical protein
MHCLSGVQSIVLAMIKLKHIFVGCGSGQV